MPADFTFKEFHLKQNTEVMPLSTDAILLGCWVKFTNESRILEVGSGTGILSLMLAQRYSDIKIHAIDSSTSACELSRKNFLKSKWSDRLIIEKADFHQFNPATKFDHLVSNPPFFEKSLPSKNPLISKAKHITDLSPFALVEKANSMLIPNGKISLIVEYHLGKKLLKDCHHHGFYPGKITKVKSKPTKPPHRLLIELSTFVKNRNQTIIDSLSIYDHSGKYSKDYLHLSKDFYLKEI